MSNLDTIFRVGIIYLVVAVLAGGIAYLGNQLGRTIGRRKMSVWRMRPRHTSIFLTTLMGIVTALMTLTLAALFSEPVRLMLVGVDELRREEQELRREIARLGVALERGRVVWDYDEKILQTTVVPSTAENVRQQILSALSAVDALLVQRNNQIARERGDEELPEGASLIDHNAQQFQRLLEQVVQTGHPMGLRVVVARNSFYREKVPVRLEFWPVQRVFAGGEEVVRARVVPGEYERSLRTFLERLRQTALERGLVELPGEGLGFGITSEEWDRLLDRMLSQVGPAELVAVANRDLYETSWLDVRLEVRPARSALSGGMP